MHEKLQEITHGLGPDVIVEAVGTPTTFTAAVEEVAFTGRVVYIVVNASWTAANTRGSRSTATVMV